MEILDCMGMPCPEPVLQAKACLEKAGQSTFKVLVDNEASRENVIRFGRSQGCSVSAIDGDHGEFVITLVPGNRSSATNTFQSDEYRCDLSDEQNLIYVIASDSMGSGSDELGWALLQTYVNTIPEVSPLPSHILLYNGGVKLATTEGKALETLKNLEKKGVTIWSCGTCLEFFKLENERKVGSITNMFDIMSTMASAKKVVSPW